MSTAGILAMQMGSTALKAYGSLQQGNEAARVARQNAEAVAGTQLANAGQVRREASRREELVRRQGRAAIGKQTAAMAQSGILGTGTGVGVMQQSMVDAELDALNTRYEGISRSNAMMTDAANTMIQGRNAAAAAKAQGRMGAIGALMSGAASAYGIYAQNSAAEPAVKPDAGQEYYINPQSMRFQDAYDNPDSLTSNPFGTTVNNPYSLRFNNLFGKR